MQNKIEGYKEHLTAFIDLLGFKAAIDTKDKQDILELLQSFARQVGDYHYSERPTIYDNITEIRIRPTITVFSDNIVISYPIDDETNPMKNINRRLMGNLLGHIMRLASYSLSKGFLIRGGIAKGMLYHMENVVFGDALIEAYELESKKANMPRVLISDGVKDFFGIHDPIVQDKDGKYMLNYWFNGIKGIIDIDVENGPLSFQNKDKKIAILDKVIQHNIEHLNTQISHFAEISQIDEKEKYAKILQKWEWFNIRYNENKSAIMSRYTKL